MKFKAMQGNEELQLGPDVMRSPNENEMELRCLLLAGCESKRQYALQEPLLGLKCVPGQCAKDVSEQ